MKFFNKLQLLNNFFDLFSIKLGKKFLDNKNDIYQTNKLISFIFHFYYGGVVYFVILFLFLLTPHFFTNIFLEIFETLVLYIIIEVLTIFFIPLKKLNNQTKST